MAATDRVERERFRYQLPYPIAINYKLIGACAEPNARRLMHILKTAEMTARFLTIVALSELRRATPAGGLGARASEFARRFAAPSFGTWLWILRESLTALRQADATLLVEELVPFLIGRDGKPTAAARDLDALCSMRNRFAHDQVPEDDWLQPRHVPDACETSLAALERVLGAALFLAEYPLVVMSPVIVQKKRGAAPRFQRNKIVLAGCADVFDHDRDVADEICETAEALLLDRRGERYLNLDPLLLYSADGTDLREIDGEKREVRTEIRDVFVYNGGRSKDRQYLACHKGGALRSRDLEENEHIEQQFAELTTVLCVAEAS